MSWDRNTGLVLGRWLHLLFIFLGAERDPVWVGLSWVVLELPLLHACRSSYEIRGKRWLISKSKGSQLLWSEEMEMAVGSERVEREIDRRACMHYEDMVRYGSLDRKMHIHLHTPTLLTLLASTSGPLSLLSPLGSLCTPSHHLLRIEPQGQTLGYERTSDGLRQPHVRFHRSIDPSIPETESERST